MEELNFILLQYWEISELGDVVYPDGVSIHIDLGLCGEYINSIYIKRVSDKIDPSYQRVVGKPIIATITTTLMDAVLEVPFLRLSEVEFNNLVNIGDIVLT